MKLIYRHINIIILLKINSRNDIIYSLYVNIGGKSSMKVLRAIGGFFAKIGRWIASTAWIQPLLIVGGIFGIIFSIPYIKKGIEGLQTDNTDYKYEYYKDHALGLKEDGKADKLLHYLDEYEDNVENIRKDFGAKFFLTFVKKDCVNCKDGVAGFKNLSKNFSSWKLDHSFKLYTILVDKTDDDGEYLAKKILRKNNGLFEKLAADYGEADPDYPLYRNLPDKKKGIADKIAAFPEQTLTTSNGMETPTTFLIDLDGAETNFSVNGITQIFFNYSDFITGEINARTKGAMLRDAWSYQGVFDPEYEAA